MKITTNMKAFFNSPSFRRGLGGGLLCLLLSSCGLYGKYSNGARAILVPVDSFDNPQLCQVKICGMTKTYVFEKINRLEGRHALR